MGRRLCAVSWVAFAALCAPAPPVAGAPMPRASRWAVSALRRVPAGGASEVKKSKKGESATAGASSAAAASSKKKKTKKSSESPGPTSSSKKEPVVAQKEDALSSNTAEGDVEGDVPALREATRVPVVVHEIEAVVDEGERRDVVLLSASAALNANVVAGDCVRLHGPRRTTALARVAVDASLTGETWILSRSSGLALGLTRAHTLKNKQPAAKLLAVPCGVGEAGRVVVAPLDESTEEDEDALFDSHLAPRLASSGGSKSASGSSPAGEPVRAGAIFLTTDSGATEEDEEEKRWRVISVEPSFEGVVTGSTEVIISFDASHRAEDPLSDESSGTAKTPSYDDLGGVDEYVEALREIVEVPLHTPRVFSSLGVAPPKGALIFGPPGCGKSQLSRAAAYESGAHVEVISGAEYSAKKAGDAEEALRAVFARAESKAPSIIVIDDVELIGKKRDKAASENEKRLTSQLLTLMDGLRPAAGVVVLAATGKANDLDPALRRFGRLDREIEMAVPDEKQRLDILIKKTRRVSLASDVDLRLIADECHGFVGADLGQLCTEAALCCVKDNLLKAEALLDDAQDGDALLDSLLADVDVLDDEDAIQNAAADLLLKKQELLASDNDDGVLLVTQDHLQRALKTCNPSSLRESVVEVPDVSWADVGGLEGVKQELKETVEYPVQYSGLYNEFGLPPSKGVLFYGPPGCGKTLIAKAVANECGANFISVKGPELLTMWFGESEANVRNLFDKARAAAPCVLFFDEMDSIAKARSANAAGSDAGDRVMNQILAEIDAVGSKNVFVVGATNRPDILDPAVTRPGRLDQLVHIPLPDYDSRKAVFRAALRKAPVAPDVDVDQLAKATVGFSGADIAEICQRAAKNAVKAAVIAEQAALNANNTTTEAAAQQIRMPVAVDAISRAHFEEAMSRARRSVPDSEVERYKRFTDSLATSAKADKAQRFDFDRGFVGASSSEEDAAVSTSSSSSSGAGGQPSTSEPPKKAAPPGFPTL